MGRSFNIGFDKEYYRLLVIAVGLMWFMSENVANDPPPPKEDEPIDYEAKGKKAHAFLTYLLEQANRFDSSDLAKEEEGTIMPSPILQKEMANILMPFTGANFYEDLCFYLAENEMKNMYSQEKIKNKDQTYLDEMRVLEARFRSVLREKGLDALQIKQD